MLERPSLLLNPWAIRSTETGQQEAQAGEEFQAAGGSQNACCGRQGGAWPRRSSAAEPISPISIFWPPVRSWWPISRRTKNGMVEFKRADLGPHQELLFVAVDPQNTVSRIVALAGRQVGVSRSAIGQRARSEAALHAAEADQHSCRRRDRWWCPTSPARGSRLTTALAGCSRCIAALNNDPKLAEFNFIRNWPSLKPEEKRALVSQIRQPRIAFLSLQEGSRVLQDGDPAIPGEQEGKAVPGSLALGRRPERISQAVEFRAAQHVGADLARPANPRRAGHHGSIGERSVRSAAARSGSDSAICSKRRSKEFAGDERSARATAVQEKAKDIRKLSELEATRG